MGYPRRLLVNYAATGYYHCISRCVRRAHLLGGEWEDRREWVESRLIALAEVFAIDSCAYAILSNHLHIVVRINPDAAAKWSGEEVARRWCRLYPKRLARVRARASSPEEADRLEREHVQNLAAQKDRIRVLRARLCDLGWFHKLLKEPLARSANREDNCTGHFWEGRFKSYRLLDDAAILACMVYVDLNVFRAGIARKLDECEFTSLLQRLKVIRAAGRSSRSTSLPARRRKRQRTTWLLTTDDVLRMTATQYVSLVASTGGIPFDEQDHGARLTALGIDPSRWKKALTTTVRRIGSVVGSAISCLKEAERRRGKRVVNAIDIYRE